MKQKNILKIAFAFLLISSVSYGQTTIYQDTFTGEDGKGTIGATTDLTGVDWSIDTSNGTFTDNSDFFAVQSGVFETQDVDGDVIFTSETFSISGYTNLQFIFDAGANGDFEASGDIYEVRIYVDGTPQLLFEGVVNEAAPGDPMFFGATELSTTLQNFSTNVTGTGTNAYIEITVNNNVGTEEYFFDNLEVQGTLASSNPTVSFDSATSTETETDATFTSANIPITVSNYSGTQININISITGGTAEVGDYTFTSPTALSFSADGTQNITVDINDDADTDDETIILTITETSSVTGLTITEATHTITITDDETPPAPTLVITEIADTGDNDTARFVEIYNNGLTDIDFSVTPIYISRFTNGNPTATSSNVEELSTGTLSAGHYLVIASSGTNFTSVYGFSADEINGGFGVNGDDPFGMYSGTYPNGTLFDVYGEIGVDGTGQSWEYEDSRAVRNNIMEAPSTTWQASSWTISATNVADATPGASENEFRYDGAWKPRDVYTNATSTDNILISASVNLTNNLDVNNFDVTNSAAVTINSGTALKVNGTATGNVTYNTTLATTNWYLMSSPVSGVVFNSTFVGDNNIDDTSSSSGNIGIAEYDSANNDWSYLQTSGSITSTSGVGYSMKQDVTSSVAFTGSLNTENVTVTGLNTTGFNLLGNPYTAYKATQSFLNGNEQLDQQGIWVWNQAINDYEVKVKGENFTLAPTQGFFVKSNGASQVQIFESSQSLTGNAFQKTVISQLKLFMNDGKNQRFVKLYYKNNATTGYDVGWEGEVFGGIAHSLEVFSSIVAQNDGKKYQLQSLPNSDYENMVVPIGIIAEADKEITFTAESLNLPSDLKVFLEDRLTNTFTRLDEVNSKYTITLTEKSDGVGRFYLHTKSSSVLSTTETLLESVRIYKTNAATLKIAGLSQGKTNVKLFTMLGKQVVNTSFTSNGTKEISLPNLATGVYIVSLETETGKLNKKITLE